MIVRMPPQLKRRVSAEAAKRDVGIGSRAERVVVITAGLVLAPWWHCLDAAIYVLTVTAWFTVVQRVLSVRSQLRSTGDSTLG